MQVYRSLVVFLTVAALSAAPVVHAHDLLTSHAGFMAGFSHPFLGLDHVLAMVAVGLVAAQQGARLVWKLPVTFLLLMAIGASTGANGLPLPMVEAGVASSALVLGLVIALGGHLPANAILAMVGIFALLHGHAHGLEMPVAASAVIYVSGFLTATASLHLLGFASGIRAQRLLSTAVLRIMGAAIAAGSFLLWA